MSFNLKLLILGTALALSGCSKDHYKNHCERTLPPMEATIKIESADPVYDFSLSRKELEKLAPSRSGNGLGLTIARGSPTVWADYPHRARKFFNTVCARPKIKATLSFSPVTVYVAKEYPKGSCQHAAILAHEQEHVRIYERRLTESRRALKSYILEKYDQVFLFDGSLAAVAGARDLAEDLGLHAAAFMGIAELEQQVFDSKEEYAKLSQQCEGQW